MFALIECAERGREKRERERERLQGSYRFEDQEWKPKSHS